MSALCYLYTILPRKEIIMTCFNCGIDTTNPRFCSRSCSASYNNKIAPKRKKKDKVLKIRPSLSQTTKGELISKSTYKSNAYGLIRFHARKFVYQYKDKICEKCGYEKHTEVCHLIPIKDFTDNTLISSINSLENLIILCPNCHWEHDNL